MEYDLRRLQEVELNILLEVDRICKKNNITYMLCFGTLLGAIRHKGFIPWDDDIDITMPYDDYIHFCDCCKTELNPNYFLQTYETDNVSNWFAKIRDNNTTMIETGCEKLRINQGVWIDIFPLISVSEKTFQETQEKAKKIKTIITKKKASANWNKLSFDKKLLKLVPNNLFYSYVRKKYQRILKSPVSGQKCCYLWGDNKIFPRFEYRLFEETENVLFEGHLLPAPKKWDEYLTIVYGDYMTPPPVESRTGGSHMVSIVDLDKPFSAYL